MFSKGFIVFALLALFAVHSSSAHQVQRLEERALTDLVQKAKDAIKKLGELVTGSVNDAISQLLNIKDKLFARANEVIADAKDTIANIVDKVQIQIEHIKEQAQELGMDVKECVEENSSALAKLPKNIIDKLVECVTEQLNNAMNIIQQAISDILSIKDQLAGLPGKLAGCITSGNPITCVTNLIGEIINDISSIPSDIQNSVNKILELVANLEKNLTACALSKVIEASKEAAAIGAEVAKCVAGKVTA